MRYALNKQEYKELNQLEEYTSELTKEEIKLLELTHLNEILRELHITL